jgi:predicted component of type VI protein secretion system
MTYKNGSLRLADLNSPNFTFLNNQKLIPNQSRILRDGDEIRLGRLVMTVQFGERTLEKPSA